MSYIAAQEPCRVLRCATIPSSSIFAVAASSSPAPATVAVGQAAPADEDRGARSSSTAPTPSPEVRGLGGRGPARARRARARRRATPTARRSSTAPTGDAEADARAAAIGRAAGALVNIVDNLDGSDFITPAIVDRDPVTVAIGTEGAAPVLARKIKAEVEAMLPATLGRLTRIGQAFRARVEALDSRRARRAFWTRFYFERGPLALAGRRGGRPVGARARCSPRATRAAARASSTSSAPARATPSS